MLTVGDAAAVAGITCAASIVTRTTGFGFALFAVPLMAFVVPTKSAVVIVLMDAAIVSASLTIRLHQQIVWKTTRWLGTGAVIGSPLGVVILRVASATTLRLVLGITTCLAAGWIVVSSRVVRPRSTEPHHVSTLAIGLTSGVLNTSLATNGPPIVFELRRRGLRDNPFRATLSAVFVLSDVIGLVILAIGGLITTFDISLVAVSLVPCAIGVFLGSQIAGRLRSHQFVWVVDGLLLLTGLMTITKAVS